MAVQGQVGPFDNVMTDVSGKVRLEGGDPRWIQLFSSNTIPDLVGADLTWYASRLRENNRATGNFIQLLDQTFSRLQQVTSRKVAPSGQLLEQCCVSLFISTIVLHHFIAFSTPQQLSDHLFASDFNRIVQTTNSRGTNIIEKLLCEIGLAIDSPSVNAQIYSPLRQNSEFPCVNGSNEVMLSFLFSRAECQLRVALGSGQHSSNTFSACLAVQLVRGLINSACGADMKNSANSAEVAVKAGSSTTHTPSTQLLKEILGYYRQQAAHNVFEDQTSPHKSTLGETVQDIFIGFLKVLPFGVLHRIFSPSAPPALTPGETTISSNAALRDQGFRVHSSEEISVGNMTAIARPVPGAICIPDDPVAERSLALLMILLHNRRTATAANPNPFREAFGLLHDPSLRLHGAYGADEEDEEGGRGQILEEEGEFTGRKGSANMATLGATRISVSFPAIVETFCRKLPDECCTLLLYSCIHSQPSFTETLTKSGSLPTLLAACLHGLYMLSSKSVRKEGSKAVSAGGKSLNQLYVLIVCLLMLLQDCTVLSELRRGQEVGMKWYKERRADTMALIDACFLCVLRCLVHSLLNVRDQYLLSNNCAILHNLAAQLTCGLQPYTAERLVKVTCRLCLRLSKDTPKQMCDVSCESLGAHSSNVDIHLLSEAVVTLLQVLDSALRAGRLSANVHVLYALMKDFHSVEESFVQPQVLVALYEHGIPNSLAAGIVLLARKSLEVVEQSIGEGCVSKFSAAQMVDFLRKEIEKGSFTYGNFSLETAVSGSSTTDISENTSAAILPRRKYVYEEAENAEEFFVPAVWTAVIRTTPELPWQLLGVTLFDTVAAGFVAVSDTADFPPDSSVSYDQRQDDTVRNSTSVDQV